MTTQILFFGFLKDIANTNVRAVDLPASINTIDALITYVCDGDLALGKALNTPSVRIAIDQHIAPRDTLINAPKEIAFMPPFSGG